MNTNKVFIVVGYLTVSFNAYSLNTTHTHPLVTERIATLIESTDATEKQYQELYETYPGTTTKIYWGTDYDATLTPGDLDQSYLLDDNLPPYGNNFPNKNGGYDNVIDGVVQEDAPATKVLDHFQHAMDGSGLSIYPLPAFNPSSQRAMGFFNEAVARMSGYSESAKQTAYFEFGQALHHVEDMITQTHFHRDLSWVEI